MISLCITTYNRFEMLMESFAQVLNDDRISEIVIVDDCSDITIYDKILASTFDMSKVRLIRNSENLGMSLNKRKAIEAAKNDWCIIFDSDNVIGPDYLDAMFPITLPLDHTTIYCPSFARPRFDFRKYEGWHILHAGNMMQESMGECFFNCCNYMVNRDEYLRVYEHNPAMKGTDTIWFNYLWLKARNSFYVVPGMEYIHRVHDGSGFLQDCSYNMKRAKEIKELIKAL
jgi:glycosyltransferase involved in cell wall biosynthesis